MDNQNSTVVTTAAKLPSIKELFVESWNVMVANILNLLFLSIGAIVSVFGLIIAFTAVGLVLAMAMGLLKGVNNPASLVGSAPALVILGILLITGMFVSMVVVSMLFAIAPQRLLAGEKKEMTLFGLVKNGGRFIFPLIAVSFLSGFFVLGGFWLFFIPGLFIAIFVVFAQYEVILGGKRGMNALKGSVRIITQNFGEILVRYILFLVGYVILIFFIPNVIAKADQSSGIIISGLWVIVSILANWYSMAFGITLYKQAKTATDENKPAGMNWIVLVSVIGWLLAVAGMVIGFSVAGNMIRNAPKYQRRTPSVYQQQMYRENFRQPERQENSGGVNSL